MELVNSDDFGLDAFQPPDDLFSRCHGALGVAVLLARALGHHGDATNLAHVTHTEVCGICLEAGHLGCTVVMEHPVCSYAHAMEVFDPRLTSDRCTAERSTVEATAALAPRWA